MIKNTLNDGIQQFAVLFIICALALSCGRKKSDTLVKMDNVRSEYIDERNVDIWLPSSYFVEKVKKYPVLYMHDGQNLFDTAVAYGGVTWGVAEWVNKMSAENKIPEIIVVGIWNTPKRYREYMPDKPFYNMDTTLQKALTAEYGGPPLGDQYLKFIVNELKPLIDSTYRTMPAQKHTFIMGSSMGGLISAYAITEYPEVFRGAGCLSTHWIGHKEYGGHDFSNGFAKYLEENLPSPKNHKYYFDYGTVTLDALYEPHQLKIDTVMENAGYLKGQNWVTFKFEGAEHNEASWQKRLHIPLNFLLNKN